MKRLVLLVVVALGMSATSFAGEKVEGKGDNEIVFKRYYLVLRY